MLTCPKCHEGNPEGMRFCLQCGASLAPASAPVAPPAGVAPARPAAPEVPAPLRPPHRVLQTIALGIAPTPVLSPRARAPAELPRPSLDDQRLEVDEEILKKSFAKPLAQPGVVVCRFCRGPLDLEGDFCDHCGAPVAEAAPPGAITPKPQPAVPPGPPAAASEPPLRPPELAAPVAPSPAASAPELLADAAPLTPDMPAAESEPMFSLPDNTPGPGALLPPDMPAEYADPTLSTPEHTPAPITPMAQPTHPAEEHPSGFMSRLKGLFKKG